MKTDFALMNPGGIRADVGAGDVTWGHLFTVQPFNNKLVKMNLTGEQIWAVLNQQWQGQKNRQCFRFPASPTHGMITSLSVKKGYGYSAA
ncbi:hypothetical protein GCM10020331_090670 [Ectobacillus funiculus]